MNMNATGNQTKVGYPDGTSVTKTYDLVGNLESVVESDGPHHHLPV